MSNFNLGQKNDILLSVCIPTRNRAELVHKLVLECLEIDSERIEVVVSDNFSNDATEELLSEISDKRFHYYRNSENTGADNIGRCVTKGNGKFSLLLRDKDLVSPLPPPIHVPPLCLLEIGLRK